MKRTYTGLRAIFTIIVTLLLGALPASAQISLGTSQSFGVLGGSTVTNTGPSSITGNVGVSPGSSVTGFPPGVVVGGAIHAGDATAGQAQTDLTTAYTAAAGTACNVDLTGQNLGGLTLTPGVYCFSSSAFLTGTLTLDLQGNPNAFFLFKMGSTLTTASGSSILLINSGGTTCPPNLYWQVGSSATLGTGSSFTGNILALTSITLNTGANMNGRALARNGAVTLDTNTVASCAPVIACPVVTVNPATLPNGTVGTVYNQTVSGSGGAAPYTFAVTSGALPSGLVLDLATGEITGTPLTAGTFDFTITATDSNGCPGSRPYTIVIAALGCPVITLSPATLPAGELGVFYDETIVASGGTGPYTFSVTSGTLPNGLTLGATTGAITGTPTAPGLFTFTIQATDANDCLGSRPYSIAIAPATATGAPALDFVGLAILIVLLGGAGVFVMTRLSM
ncbi:MAG TPA: ice-binding family protein [Thermoanaerobaculia bacterium]|nr:ice-binding family protein [Thermoanaerobaculia bacterium]